MDLPALCTRIDSIACRLHSPWWHMNGLVRMENVLAYGQRARLALRCWYGTRHQDRQQDGLHGRAKWKHNVSLQAMRKFTYSRIWKKTKRNRDKILRVGRYLRRIWVYKNFGHDRLRGFDVGKGQISPFCMSLSVGLKPVSLVIKKGRLR